MELVFREELLLVSKCFSGSVEIWSFVCDFSYPKSWLGSTVRKYLHNS